jgi:succinoglycan biosynthesis protein ExoA
MPNLPSVTVLLPAYNERRNIDACLESLQAQEYGGDVTVVVAEGGSDDGTRERLVEWLAQFPGLQVIDNPRRLQSFGLNLAAEAAKGDVLVRADAHTTYAPDYLIRSVAALTGSAAVAVGGLQRAEGRTAFGEAVAVAMHSPLGLGPARFRHARQPEEVDTVYLGAFRRADFHELGGYRSLPTGVAEDADLYFRWRQQGRVVLVDPAIRSTYRPRDTVKALARQHWRYGVGKAEMAHANGRLPSWRPLAPLGLLLGLVSGLAAWVIAGWPWLFAGVVVAWLAVIAAVALRQVQRPALLLRVVVAVVTMHLSYGAGLAWGLARGPRHVRRHLDGASA